MGFIVGCWIIFMVVMLALHWSPPQKRPTTPGLIFRAGDKRDGWMEYQRRLYLLRVKLRDKPQYAGDTAVPATEKAFTSWLHGGMFDADEMCDHWWRRTHAALDTQGFNDRVLRGQRFMPTPKTRLRSVK